MDFLFIRYDTDHSQFIDQAELQIMMEKLEAPQTFLGLKAMIKEVDEDQDGQISFREVSICLIISSIIGATFLKPFVNFLQLLLLF